MKNLVTYIFLTVLAMVGFVSCDTDVEALDIVVPDEKSEQYWADLRAYKARTDHEVFFGWFGGWTANSADMINFLESVPDSVDIISIWGDYKNLSPAQREDLHYVQNVKGTRVTYTIFAHKIPDEFMSGENHEVATKEGIEMYAKALVDTMYKYGYQGIDLDYEPGYQEFPGVPFSGPLVGPIGVWPDYKNNMEIFVKALGKYIGPKSGTRNLLIIDGVPYHLNPGLAEYFNYGVVQSYNSGGFSDLQRRFDYAAANGWKPEQYIFAETFEGGRYANGGVDHTTRPDAAGQSEVVPSLLGMARFLPMYEGKLATRKGGCGTYHMENDYRSTPNYKWTREAIRLMQEHK